MKGLIKLFSVAAVAGAMASCSDDLSLSKNAGFIENADLYATLNVGDEDATRMGVKTDKTVVWSEGDQIKVYSPDALKFNTYDLVAGAGEIRGSFVVNTDNGVAELPNKVAISSSEYLKGVYANEDGSMQLIAKIPGDFNQSELHNGSSVIYWPLKVPYYGLDVSFNGDGSLNATMNPLTALLKIDIAALPAGTKAIVLTTHWDSYIQGWMTDDGIIDARNHIAPVDRADYVLGGKDEPLSGTLTCKLEPGTKLVVDEDFKHADTLRVNIDELEQDQDKVIFIPVVAQHYEKLTVLAVTDDSKVPYFWPNAEVLRVFEDQDFVVSGRYTLAQAAPVPFYGTSAEELSKFIAEKILNDGAHTINIDVVNPIDGDYLFIANNLIPELDPTISQSSVNIYFEQPTASEFDIVEAEANYNPTMSGWRTLSTSYPWLNIPTAPYNNVYSKAKKRTVTITFAEGEANDHNVILPTSNVILDADGTGIAGATIAVVGSNTKEVSGYTDEDDWNTPRNHTNAGIVLKGSNAGIYEILPGQLGHIYAKGDGIDDEIAEIQIDGILTYPANIDLRVTDMLVQLIDYPQLGANAEGVIYTTGNAAIKDITEQHTGHGNTIKVNASWTGKQLSTYALQNGYDQSEIFTAAQLQGMGRATHVLGSGSPAYYEMNDRVRSVWLGASLFPWIGADVTMPDGTAISSAFTFNGKNTNLRNMVLDLYEPWLPVDCCCADNRVRVDANLGLISRVITTSTVDIYDVDLSDVLINTQKFVIPNIGAICGLIDADGAVSLNSNSVASVRIDARGTNIGGAFGLVDSESDVTIYDLAVTEASAIYGKSWVESEAENVGGLIGAIANWDDATQTYDYVYYVNADKLYIKGQYVRSQDDNVGGQVGFIKTEALSYGFADIANNYVELDHEVYSNGGSNVGGLIGQADYQNYYTYIFGTVFVRQRIQADINDKATNPGNSVNESGSNVGGLVGLDIVADALNATSDTQIEGSVSTKVIKAENRNAGGFVGYYEAGWLETHNNNNNTVKVSQLLEATEGYAGGLYGYIRTANRATIGTIAATNKHINVTIKEIAGAKAVGGLIGATTEPGNAGSTYEIDVQSNAKSKININIDQWTITKTPSFFRTTGDRKMNGSFGTVIGWLNGRINIMDGNLTVAEKDGILKKFKRDDGTYGGPDFESKNPIFTEAKKINLLFILQKVSQSTEGVEYPFVVGGDVWASWWNSKEWVTGQGLFFWGDENGYVGVNNNSGAGGGSYVLNDVALWGNVNYNLYYDWSTPIWQDELPINYSHD